MVPETQDELRIGDFVDVVIEADPISGALKLPATALSGQSEHWVLDGEQLSKRDITVIGETDNGAAIITRPFDIGDGVVALPPLEARDGQIVSVRQTLDVSAATGGRIDAAQ